MSESISTNTYSSIFNESKDFVLYTKILIVILIFIIICLSCMSCMSTMTIGQNSCSSGYDYFTNTETNLDETYKKVVPIKPNNFQSIPLTNLENDEFNLQFGQINRTIVYNNGNIVTNYDIFANLYILDGNIFQEKEKDHVYKVFLSKESEEDKILVGKLYKDGDGIYKLKKQFTDDMSSYKNAFIVYTKNNIDKKILYGTF